LIALFLTILMVIQDPALPRGGTVTGVLRTAAGTPAPRVRVAATLVPSDPADISSAALVSLSETDEQGRYVLENIPPGRYYIVAGRVDLPTFYPGKLDSAEGTMLEIPSGTTRSGIDFAVDDSSTRLPPPSGPPPSLRRPPPISIPVRVRVEGEDTLPPSPAGQVTTIQLTASNGSLVMEVPLKSTTVTLPGGESEYNIRIVNLPDGYVVTSMTFNGMELTNSIKVPATQMGRTITFAGEGRLQEAIDQATQRANEAARTLSITLSRKDVRRQ
jgi:hypothetical protein